MKKRILILGFLCVSITAKSQIKDSLQKDSTNTILLKQVAITTIAPKIIQKTDRTVLNVESMSNAAGLNLLELLRQAPGVTLDGQDNVKMSGKNGIQVLLDGRLQLLSSQQITSLLKGTNAANIKLLEIITNPSAKYDAAGNAGIINIIFKKSDQRGMNGTISGGYQQMQNYRQNAAMNLNFKYGRFNLYTNANADNSLQHTKVQSVRLLTTKAFEQSGVERQGYSNPGIRIGAEYALNEQHKIGAQFNLQHVWDDFPSNATTQVKDPINPDVLNTITTANLTEDRYSYNLNYRYTNKNKSILSIEADRLAYNSDLENLVNNSFDKSIVKTDFNNHTITAIKLNAVKADLTTNLGKASVETGVKFSLSQTHNVLNASQSNNNGQSLVQYNNFDYREKNYASYISSNRKFGKWTVQIGLRAEFTEMKGLSTNELNLQTHLPDTSYLNLFPTAFLTYQLNERKVLSLSYSRRINRPSFQDQNPYNYRTDFYYSNQGNPLLLPQFTHTLELALMLNGQTQLKLNLNQTRDLIEIVSTQQGDQTLTLPVNAGKRSFINISISSPAKLTKHWSIYYTAEPYYQFYQANLSQYSGLAKISNGGFGLNSYISNDFSISKTIKGSLSSWFNYASRSSIYTTKPIYSIDASIKKDFIQNKLAVTLAFRDLLNTQRWAQTVNLGNVNQTSVRKWESRGLYIAASYNFGKSTIRVAEEKEKSEEQKRIKGRD